MHEDGIYAQPRHERGPNKKALLSSASGLNVNGDTDVFRLISGTGKETLIHHAF